MGKRECCSYCVEFNRDKMGNGWGSSRVVEIPGCSKCHERHNSEVVKLQAELKSWQVRFDEKKNPYEIDLARLKEKSTLDLLNQKAEYEQLIAKLTIELNNLKVDNSGNRSKIEFLKIRRDCSQGDVIIAVSDSRIFAHRTILAERSPVFQKFLQGEISVIQMTERPLIKLDCVSSPVIEAIVDFCYSGEIIFSEVVSPREVLIFAHAFSGF